MSDSSATNTHSPAVSEEHSHEAEHIAKHLKGYLVVGGILLFFTLITVWLSYVDFDRMFARKGANFLIAMIVATFKVSLVGAIFMHLKGEKAMIWRFLFFTAFFVTGLFLLTLFAWSDPIWSTNHTTH